jgi:hypothetical protein
MDYLIGSVFALWLRRIPFPVKNLRQPFFRIENLCQRKAASLGPLWLLRH